LFREVLAAAFRTRQPISPRRIEKPGSAAVASASRGPHLTIDDHPSPLGPVCTQAMRSLASTTQSGFDHASDILDGECPARETFGSGSGSGVHGGHEPLFSRRSKYNTCRDAAR
jgi:hypothetical protein